MQNSSNKQSPPRTRSLKQLLTALGGATVSIGATFSLFLTSAQAASFVTTFETDGGDVTLEWSGEDTDGDDIIDDTEVIGPLTLSAGGDSYVFGGISTAFDAQFEFNPGSNQFQLGEPQPLPFGRVRQSLVGFVNSSNDLQFDIRGFDGSASRVTINRRGPSGVLLFDAQYEFAQTTQSLGGGGGGTGGGGGGSPSVSTPEPTLTLGLITLGGLMLGSKRKRKA